ncbi:MAG: WYL domain-containing protein [Oscillospiraceae bacterium]|nr:WYL domain-containing protein [Oscillospiraceae bacterium]
MEEKARHGKKPNQKLKTYLVMQYLIRESDEDHPQNADEIVSYLETVGIFAERKSIYKDIRDINIANLIIENGITAEEAEIMLDEDPKDEYDTRLVKLNRKRGFYVVPRHYSIEDIRFLAECIGASKFIPEKKAKELVKGLTEDYVSIHQQAQIITDTFVVERTRKLNPSLIYDITTLNNAIKGYKDYDGKRVAPHKVSFLYKKADINNFDNSVSRRRGERYTVSPYKVIIHDGNYYLLAVDDKYKQLRTYRIDRIAELKAMQEKKENKELFENINIDQYIKRKFQMMSGKEVLVTLQFTASLLDTVLDRFGAKGVNYRKIDEHHFTVQTYIEVSDQFFGWLCGFGRRAKITAPEELKIKYKNHLDNISKLYEKSEA